MKRTMVKLSGFVFLLAIILTVKPAGAVTYAYIPSYDNDKVIRVRINDGYFDSFTIDSNIIESNTCDPYGVAVMPDGSFVLVSCEGDDSLLAITNTNFEDETQAILRVPVGEMPRGIAIDPLGEYAYVANYEDDTLTKIDIGAQAIDGDPIDVGDGPLGVAAIRDEDNVVVVYVTNYLDGTISVYTDDGNDRSPETISAVGNGPVGIAATPDGEYLYVANEGRDGQNDSGSIVCIQTSDNTIVSNRLAVGEGYWGVAVGNQGEYVYVTNTASSRVTVISTEDNSIMYNNLGVDGYTYGVAAPKNSDYAYAVNQLNGTISDIDLSGTTPFVENGIKDNDHKMETPYALGGFIGGAPPAAPSDLTGTTDRYDRIYLTWSDNSDDELGFIIQRRIKAEDGEEDDDYRQITQVKTDVTSYTDEGLEDATTYEYRICSFNEVAESEYVVSAPDEGVTTVEGRFSWCFIGTLLH